MLANTVKLASSGSGDTLDLGSNNLTITSASATSLGGLLYVGGGDNNYTISGTGKLITSNTSGELIMNIAAGMLTLAATNVTAGATGGILTKTGAGTLFENVRMLNRELPVWVEDESHYIGGVNIPNGFFDQVIKQTVYFIDIPKEKRAEYLVSVYAAHAKQEIAYAITGIAKRLGGQNVKQAIEHLENNNYFEVGMIALQYYDKAYSRGVNSRNQEKVFRISAGDTDCRKNAKTILKFVNRNERN